MYYGDMSDIKDVANMIETRLDYVGQSDARFKLGETIRYSPGEVKHILLGDYKPKQYEQEIKMDCNSCYIDKIGCELSKNNQDIKFTTFVDGKCDGYIPDDSISRGQAIQAMYKLCNKENEEFAENPHIDAIVYELENLPEYKEVSK